MGARIEETRCKPMKKRRKKKATKPKPKPKPKRDAHPSACDYPRYSGKVDRESNIWRMFDRTAKLLGEVEAGMDAFFRLAQHHGLMAAPPGGEASICTEHATAIHDDVTKLQALLSTEAKLMFPVIFMLVGDEHAAKMMGVDVEERAGETIH
jgi:hypothetical protein